MSSALTEGLIATLPTLQRLALSYAPASVRGAWLGLLALDTRLAAIVRAAREPMLAQLRLAWWREQFATTLEQAPRGEPLLAALRVWEPQRVGLAGLVDGWEAFAAASGDISHGVAELARARAGAFGALAILAERPSAAPIATRMGEGWALADLTARLGDPAERTIVQALAAAHLWQAPRLPRALRPLSVLHGLARRAVARGVPIDALPPSALATVLRIGLLGA